MSPRDVSPELFGRSVLGPVFGEFALRLHLYLLALEHPEETQLLFCARGGLRLRLVYEAFLEAAELTCPVGYSDLMVSRLVAARTALSRRPADAYEELAREFEGDQLGRVIRALTQAELPLGERGEARFTPQALARMLEEDGPGGRAVRAKLDEQNELFDEHLRSVAGPARRMILCDTGLYGSTLRFLRSGRPDYDWSCVLFARS
ncbi:MAG: hydrolase, partial [Phenylobacterium sp.]|nr:hydrolase [Phenylobacterium sp.]